jgi:hypothetical protein
VRRSSDPWVAAAHILSSSPHDLPMNLLSPWKCDLCLCIVNAISQYQQIDACVTITCHFHVTCHNMSLSLHFRTRLSCTFYLVKRSHALEAVADGFSTPKLPFKFLVNQRFNLDVIDIILTVIIYRVKPRHRPLHHELEGQFWCSKNRRPCADGVKCNVSQLLSLQKPCSSCSFRCADIVLCCGTQSQNINSVKLAKCQH